jgi:predicted dehydrogenase
LVKIALAGIAGYGDAYLEVLLPKQQALGARLVGVVDPVPQRCRRLAELDDAGIPVHATMQQLFAQTEVDLALIVTPIHLHADQTCLALEQGAHVLCEKPIAGTIADATRMAQAQAAHAHRFVAFGFQWSFSDAVQALKRDVMAGVLGRPVRMRAIAMLPRPLAYFRRNNWAGRRFTSDGGGVFDSPVNNAAAHYLHNMFYLLGRSRETSAAPLGVQAELYRANEIENYDTAAIRCRMEGGAEVLFYTSHAASERRGPRSRFEFEHATVDYDALASGQFVAKFRDGRTKYYGHPNFDRHEKIWQIIAAVRSGDPIACGIAAAPPPALAVAAANDSAPCITDFPARLRRMVEADGDATISIDRLGEQMTECYEQGVLPAERPGLPWAVASRMVDVHPPPFATAATAAENGSGNGAASHRPPPVAVTVHATPAKDPAPGAAAPLN